MFVGCNNGHEISRTSVGKITFAVVAPIGYDAKTWFTITTEKISVCISPQEVISMGAESYLIETSTGGQLFTWSGAKYQYYLSNSHF